MLRALYVVKNYLQLPYGDRCHKHNLEIYRLSPLLLQQNVCELFEILSTLATRF